MHEKIPPQQADGASKTSQKNLAAQPRCLKVGNPRGSRRNHFIYKEWKHE
jgi:hypothetical protein